MGDFPPHSFSQTSHYLFQVMPSSILNEDNDGEYGHISQSSPLESRKHALINVLEKKTSKKNKYYNPRPNHVFCINMFV
jgi:hypothetical protein